MNTYCWWSKDTISHLLKFSRVRTQTWKLGWLVDKQTCWRTGLKTWKGSLRCSALFNLCPLLINISSRAPLPIVYTHPPGINDMQHQKGLAPCSYLRTSTSQDITKLCLLQYMLGLQWMLIFVFHI